MEWDIVFILDKRKFLQQDKKSQWEDAKVRGEVEQKCLGALSQRDSSNFFDTDNWFFI